MARTTRPSGRRSRPQVHRLEDRITPVVTSLADTVDPTDGVVTLREELLAAEANPDVSVITFDPTVRDGTVTLSAFDTGLDAGELGPTGFVITTPVVVSGTGERLLRSAAAPAFRLFHVRPGGSLTLENLELEGGAAVGGNGFNGGGGAAGMGGAIFNEGTLVVRNCTLTLNGATGGNGAAYPSGQARGGGGGVGASATGCSGGGPTGGFFDADGGFGGGGGGLSEVRPGNGGFGGGGGSTGDTGQTGGAGGFGGGGGYYSGPGGFGGQGTIMLGAGGGAGMGGAVFNLLGTVTLVNSTLAGNTTLGGLMSSGGIPPQPFPDNRAASLGGGLFNLNGTVTVVQCTFEGNVTRDGGSVYSLAFGAIQGVPAAQPASLVLVNSVFADSRLTTDPLSGPTAGEVHTNQQAGTATLTASAKNLTTTAFLNDGGTAVTTGVVVSAGPVVAGLLDNGGLTRTAALLPGSPALDAAGVASVDDPVLGTPIANDQRGAGFPRAVGTAIDLGAFERPAPPAVATSTVVASSLNPSVVGDAVTFTATVTPADTTAGTPVGSVTFFVDGVAQTTVVLSGGAAAFTTSTLAVGSRTVRADYAGGTSATASFVASTGQVTQGVASPPVVPPIPPVPPINPPPVVPPPVSPPTTPPPPPAAPVRLFAVGAGYGGGPRVRVFNEDGSQRFDFFAFDDTLRTGVTVATGDVNGDGVEDILVGAGKDGGPRVRVFSGVDLAVLDDFFTYEDTFRGGVDVAAGDIDGDGRAEYFTAPRNEGASRVRGFRLLVPGYHLLVTTGLGDFYAFDSADRERVSVACGDLDGDNKAELVVASTSTDAAANRVFPTVRVFAADGHVVSEFRLPSAFLRAPDVDVLPFRSGTAGSILAVRAPFISTSTSDRVVAFDLTGAPRDAGFNPFFTATDSSDPTKQGIQGLDVAGADYLGQLAVFVGESTDFGHKQPQQQPDGTFALVADSPAKSGVRVFAVAGGTALLAFDAFEPEFTGGVEVG